MPCRARRDIFADAKVILKPCGFSDIIFAPITREANITRRKPNITAKQYHSLQANITEKSYSLLRMAFFLAGAEGLEPTTHGFGDQYSTN